MSPAENTVAGTGNSRELAGRSGRGRDVHGPLADAASILLADALAGPEESGSTTGRLPFIITSVRDDNNILLEMDSSRIPDWDHVFGCQRRSLPVPGESTPVPIKATLPLVQDEFSYQLQAQGFLERRWSWAGPQHAPEIFHQMHVLNEGRFGSRYFPGTGLWLAPWVALGHPFWGSRFAGMLISMGAFALGVQLCGLTGGMIAGALTAVAPGLAIFNNLLLSHGPCLVGLILFLNFFLRFISSGKCLDAILAGSGLAFAMLCRPLTAAAIGLPFGIWFLVDLVRNSRTGRDSTPLTKRRTLLKTLGLAAPLLAGLGVIGWQNLSLTGNLLLTPYQQYTAIYTPRHAFGFHQGTDSVSETDPRILTEYNDWAQELDLPLAVSNVIQRFRGSLAWGLGLVPLLLTFIYLLWTWNRQPLPVQLLFGSMLCLHLAHIPYWLNGMLEHHYVFEADVLMLLLFAVMSVQLGERAIAEGRWLVPVWWGFLIGISLLGNYAGIGPRGISRVAAGWQTFLRPTTGYRTFEKVLRRKSLQLPALVLICSSPNDLHAQFVRNHPPFDESILIGMERPDLYSADEVAGFFPERTLYRYDSAKHVLEEVRQSSKTANRVESNSRPGRTPP